MDSRVTEFHCIMPIENIASVLANGILSHVRAAKLSHASVALESVQQTRSQVSIPGGKRLHAYANLYFHARNPMMSKRRSQADSLCVLRIDQAVLRLPGVVLTDQNAASRYVRFYAPHQLRELPLDDIYARNWKHPDDQIAEWRHSSRKCAECLVPRCVEPQWLTGAYVVDEAAEHRLAAVGFTLPITVDSDLFFC